MSILDAFRLDGQVAVVTGASRGIGRQIALCLAEAGADVAVAARNVADLDKVVAEIEALGRSALAVQADVGKAGDVARLAEATSRELGALTIWVNNAGGQPDMKQRPFVDVSEENFDAQVALNLKSVWAGTVEAAKAMTDGGVIINITSNAAKPGNHSGHSLYGALKAAVTNLTVSLSHELGPRIRVNALAPGPTLTDTFYETLGLNEAGAQDLLPSIGIPLQRYGDPRDIGAGVVYLASPAAGWVTGATLDVSGGF